MSAHSHYHKDVRHLDSIDVYRVLDLFKVTDPCVQHAVKKLLVMGGRGAGKDADKDLQEAIDSLLRAQAMRKEDQAASERLSHRRLESHTFTPEGDTEHYYRIHQTTFVDGMSTFDVTHFKLVDGGFQTLSKCHGAFDKRGHCKVLVGAWCPEMCKEMKRLAIATGDLAWQV